MSMDEIIQPEEDAIKPSARMTCSARREEEKGIYRHDYGNTHGYRAYIKFKGQEHQRIFSDKGDPEEALEKARHWRKLKLRTLQASDDGDNRLKKNYSNNKSGIIGVCRSGNNWQAAWVEKAKPRSRKFSVEVYGEAESFRLACRARAEAEQRLYGEVIQPALQAYL
jgi:hypothetical protein